MVKVLSSNFTRDGRSFDGSPAAVEIRKSVVIAQAIDSRTKRCAGQKQI